MGVTITEYCRRHGDAQIPQEPPNDVQTAISPTSSSQTSQPFSEGSNFVELTTDTDCRFLFGDNPTAGPNNTLLKVGNTVFRGVRPGQKVAIITP